jgi:hypothetical protein
MLYSNVQRLRLIPEFRSALFVIFIEANSSWKEANRYGEYFERRRDLFGNVYVVRRDQSGKGRMGVWNAPTEKQNFADVISYSFISQSVIYAKEFNSQNEAGFKTAFENQADVFRREFKALTDPIFQKPKEVITGKGRDSKDDAMVVFGMCLDGWRTLMTTQDAYFAAICSQLGYATQFYESQ